MLHEVASLLEKLGLKDKDAKVFILLLHFKEGLYVHEIVKQSRMKRSTVDLVLRRLLAGDYITRFNSGKRIKYFSKSPESILFQKEQILADYKELLPMLNQLSLDKKDTKVFFFEGSDSVRNIHADVLFTLSKIPQTQREVLSFSSGAHLIKIFPEMQNAYIKKRVKLKAHYKAVAPVKSNKVREWVTDPLELREVRYINDKKFPFKVSFDIYGDKLAVYSPIKPVGGVVIENARIADSMRALFHFVWSALEQGVRV